MLSYNDSGRGDVVVLIHGFCESKEIWHSFEEELSAEYRVISMDLPGFGESVLQVDEVSMEYYAQKIDELLSSLKIEKSVMIGHSLGGYVTLAFAELYPQKIKGLGLFHSTAFADSAEKIASRNKVIEFLGQKGIARFMESFAPPLFYIENRKNIQNQINKIIELGSKTSDHSAIACTKAMRDRKDRVHIIQNIDLPVLYIIGKEDMAVLLESSLQQCHLPKFGTSIFLEKTAHMGMIEKEKETINAVKGFLLNC